MSEPDEIEEYGHECIWCDKWFANEDRAFCSQDCQDDAAECTCTLCIDTIDREGVEYWDRSGEGEPGGREIREFACRPCIKSWREEEPETLPPELRP